MTLPVASLMAAAVFFVIATASPLLSLDAQRVRTTTTLFGTCHALFIHGDPALAVLAFITTVLFPGVEIASMLYLLLNVKSGHMPRLIAPVFRLVEATKPWGMISVFMLGALVSLVKLHNIATVEPGLPLFSLGALILMPTT